MSDESRDLEPGDEGKDLDSLELPEEEIERVSAPHDSARFSLSARVVAAGGAILGVGCLATLAVVTAAEGDDALSTIALSLAVLAFIVQLLVFVAQSQATSQQMLRSEQLNTQTQALLSEMQTTARGTETMVREQFGQLLRAFMDAAKTAETGKGGFDQDAFERRLLTNIRRETMLAQESSRAPAQERSRTASPVPPPGSRSAGLSRTRQEAAARAQRRADTYDSGPFPSEDEAQRAIPVLRSTSPEARAYLRRLYVDKIRSSESGSYVGLSARSDFAEAQEELLAKELAQRVRVAEGHVVYQLTPLGELAGKILTSSGPIPDWAGDLFR
jgi:hypothetical protein